MTWNKIIVIMSVALIIFVVGGLIIHSQVYRLNDKYKQVWVPTWLCTGSIFIIVIFFILLPIHFKYDADNRARSVHAAEKAAAQKCKEDLTQSLLNGKIDSNAIQVLIDKVC